jgi:hypothetical protein
MTALRRRRGTGAATPRSLRGPSGDHDIEETIMGKRIITGLAALLLAGAAAATEPVDVQALADQSGLSTRQVRMVLGAHVAFAEYRTSFRPAQQKLRAVLGEVQFDELVQRYREQGEVAVAAGN